MGFIQAYMRKTNKNLLIAIILLVVAGIGFAFLNMRLLSDFVHKPVPVTVEELKSLGSLDELQNRFVDVSQEVEEFSEPVLTDGLRARVGATKIVYEYGILRMGDEYMFIKTEPEALNKEHPSFKGQLKRLEGDLVGWFGYFTNESVDGEHLLPFQLDTTTDFYKDVYTVFAILGLLVFFTLYQSYRWILRVRNPKRHIIYRRLAGQGDAEEIIRQLEGELEQGEYTVSGKYIITNEWIIKRSRFSLKFARNYFEPGAAYNLDNVF